MVVLVLKMDVQIRRKSLENSQFLHCDCLSVTVFLTFRSENIRCDMSQHIFRQKDFFGFRSNTVLPNLVEYLPRIIVVLVLKMDVQIWRKSYENSQFLHCDCLSVTLFSKRFDQKTYVAICVNICFDRNIFWKIWTNYVVQNLVECLPIIMVVLVPQMDVQIGRKSLENSQILICLRGICVICAFWMYLHCNKNIVVYSLHRPRWVTHTTK